jgi:hypothetical protein
VTGDAAGTPIPGFLVCTAGCELHAPSGICGAGLGCYPANAAATGTDCAEAGTATGAQGCCTTPACTDTDSTLCAPGYACVTSGDCLKWCRVAQGSADCPGTTCTSFSTPLYVGGPGGTEYGYCP